MRCRTAYISKACLSFIIFSAPHAVSHDQRLNVAEQLVGHVDAYGEAKYCFKLRMPYLQPLWAVYFGFVFVRHVVT